MTFLHQPAPLDDAQRTPPQPSADEMAHLDLQPAALPGAELADLYAAIAIAVPLAFVLKWLWP